MPAKVVVHAERRKKRACKERGFKDEAIIAERSVAPDSTLRVIHRFEDWYDREPCLRA